MEGTESSRGGWKEAVKNGRYEAGEMKAMEKKLGLEEYREAEGNGRTVGRRAPRTLNPGAYTYDHVYISANLYLAEK